MSSDPEQPQMSTPLAQLKVSDVAPWHAHVATSLDTFFSTTGPGSPVRELFCTVAASQDQFKGLDDKHVEPFAQVLGAHARRIPRPGPDDPLISNGMLVHDALFVDYLNSLGEEVGEWAAGIKERSTSRLREALGEQHLMEMSDADCLHLPQVWALWNRSKDRTYPRWARLLLLAIMAGPDGEDLLEQINTEKVLFHPALFRPMVERVALAQSSRLEQGQIVDDQGRQRWLVPAPSIDPLLVERFHGLEMFGSTLFDALIRTMVHEAHKQFIIDPNRRMIIEVSGGLSALASQLGFKRAEDRVNLRALLVTMTQTTVVLDHPDRFRSTVLLVDFDEVRAAPGRPTRVKLELSPLFAPQAVFSVPKGHPDRAVIPVLTAQPPLDVVNRNARPAALALEWRALIELHDRARELFEREGVELDWHKLALDSGLPTPTLPRLLESWTTGPSPRWVRDGARWTLGPEYTDAIELLKQAGRRKKSGREAARRRWNRFDKQTKLFD